MLYFDFVECLSSAMRPNINKPPRLSCYQHKQKIIVLENGDDEPMKQIWGRWLFVKYVDNLSHDGDCLFLAKAHQSGHKHTLFKQGKRNGKMKQACKPRRCVGSKLKDPATHSPGCKDWLMTFPPKFQN